MSSTQSETRSQQSRLKAFGGSASGRFARERAGRLSRTTTISGEGPVLCVLAALSLHGVCSRALCESYEFGSDSSMVELRPFKA